LDDILVLFTSDLKGQVKKLFLYGTNNVGVTLGYGNGTFTAMMTIADEPLSHTRCVAVADFNNDNQLDITVVSWGINTISVILGYGNGTFAQPLSYSTGLSSRPVSIAVGDFNNDTYLDLTTAHYGGNTIGVFLGYGNGKFRNVTTFSTGPGSRPRSVTVVDVNKDTQLDIIVANSGFHNVGIFLGYGNGSFVEQVTFSDGVDSAPYYTVAGDFNKDGYMDLASAITVQVVLVYSLDMATVVLEICRHIQLVVVPVQHM
jgi:hypothetical protein